MIVLNSKPKGTCSLFLQATRVYRVLHQCLESMLQSPLVLTLTGYAALVIEMLLLQSGDIERNPGPSECLSLCVYTCRKLMLPSHPLAVQLEPKDLVTVLTELNDVCADWENIGLKLKLTRGALDAMKGPFKPHKDCLKDAVDKWLNTSPDPSWEAIVQALRSPIVGRDHLARCLEQKYCTQEWSEPPAGKNDLVNHSQL